MNRHALLCAIALLLGACQGGRTVEVLVTGVGSDIASLDVVLTLPGRPAPEHRAVTVSLTRFLLTLPGAARGDLEIRVEGLGSDGCRRSLGGASATIAEAPTPAITVALVPQTDGCQLLVNQDGDGQGSVTATLVPAAAPCPDGRCAPAPVPPEAPTPLPCTDGRCPPPGAAGRFATGQRVTLQATPAQGSYFAGWSGACRGTDACQVQTGAGPVHALASFSLRQVCQGKVPWCYESPLPQGAELHGMWGRSADRIFAVGEQGTIQIWNGSFWVRQTPPVPQLLHAVHGVRLRPTDPPGAGGADHVVYAVGDEGVILRFDGATWTKQPAVTRKILNAVWAAAPDSVWACGKDGVMLHYDGQEWSAVDSGTDLTLNALWGSAADKIFAAGGIIDDRNVASDGIILRYDGVDWSKLHTSKKRAALLSAWGSSPDDLWFAGLTPSTGPTVQTGILVRYQDGAWSEIEDPEPFNAVFGTASDNVFLPVRRAVRHYSGGARPISRTTVSSPSRRSLTGAIWGSGPDDVWAAGAGGTLVHWNGVDFRQRTGGFQGSIWGLAGATPDNVFAVGQGIPVLRYDGSIWTRDGDFIELNSNAAWVAPDGTLWVVGASGSIISREPGLTAGTGTWITYRGMILDNLLGVWGESRDHVWVVGSKGTIVEVRADVDPPIVRTITPSPTDQHLHGIWGSGPTDIWAVGEGGTLVHRGADLQWRLVPPVSDGTLFSIWGRGPDDIWAVGTNAPGTTPIVLHYEGGLWRSLADQLDLLRRKVPVSAMYAVFGDKQGSLWALAGGQEAFVARLDRGELGAWVVEATMPSNILRLGGTDANHIWAVGDGKILRRTP